MTTIAMISASPQQKLLGEYIFQSVEDESEEKVVEKYSKEGKMYTLTVGKQNGRKHGKAELVDENNCVVAEVTFDQGNLTGPCTICNSIGVPVFKGFFKNGVKDGYCKEFDEMGNVLFEGVYVDGNKRATFSKNENGDFSGYYNETTMDGKLISISQMKKGTLIKHGRSIGFYTQNGNAVSEKVYEDGKVKWERVRVDGKI